MQGSKERLARASSAPFLLLLLLLLRRPLVLLHRLALLLLFQFLFLSLSHGLFVVVVRRQVEEFLLDGLLFWCLLLLVGRAQGTGRGPGRPAARERGNRTLPSACRALCAAAPAAPAVPPRAGSGRRAASPQSPSRGVGNPDVWADMASQPPCIFEATPFLHTLLGGPVDRPQLPHPRTLSRVTCVNAHAS